MSLAKVSSKRFSKYVGPVADLDVTARVERFQRVKANYRERRSLVTSLTAAGLPSPPALVGNIVDVLWRAGLFRLHGVLVGPAAFQTYAGLLGVRLPSAPLMTGDVDFAQFNSISVSVDDSIPPVLEALRLVDPTFREIPSLANLRATTSFSNSEGFKVEFLTPNRSKDDFAREPAPMPALGGASAQPLRYLDFLILLAAMPRPACCNQARRCRYTAWGVMSLERGCWNPSWPVRINMPRSRWRQSSP